MVVVEGGNVVHRVKREGELWEGELSGEYVREEVKCPRILVLVLCV